MIFMDNLNEVKSLFKGILPNQIKIEIHNGNNIVINTEICGNITVKFSYDDDDELCTIMTFLKENSIKYEILVHDIEIISYNEITKDSDFGFAFFTSDGQFANIAVSGKPNNTNKDFDKLVNIAKGCTFCNSMQDKEAVIGYQNGNLNADILFIAEAPGPRGANKTGIPLSGDMSGKNFEEIISSVGLERKDIFITNAVLCCPTDNKGKVRKPETVEIKNCSNYLTSIIEIVNPKIVVTIGSVALKAVKQIENHPLSLATHIATFHPWNGRFLYPLYHPSPLVINRGLRTMEQQKADYLKLARIYKNKIIKGLYPIKEE
ncbi:hypothetical protein FOA22_24480 [Heyndrickxia oleronia]|uniref:uracil-DNA glycosylase n=1 Tax=Heyndrickxia oleronia TaxID=38875 RepID=UPI000716F53B